MTSFLIRASVLTGLALSLSACFYEDRTVPVQAAPVAPAAVIVAPAPAPTSGTVIVKPTY
jgi:hypothetical protein